MPSLTAHQSHSFVKLLLIGDSGTAKTGSLVSLVQAGYKLRILDFDNGLDSLVVQIRKVCPEKLSTVQFISEGLRDQFVATPSGPIIKMPVTAFAKALSLIDNWRDGTTDLGKPATWGPDCILVIDTLTFLSDAAFNWAQAMNPSAKDPRQWYKTAQDALSHMLMMLCAAEFKTNVIVIAHIKYMERPDGGQKGYPTSVGSALSPEIPAYFNSVAMTETIQGKDGPRRIIRTAPPALVDLKNAAAVEMLPTLPVGTGLADFFKVLTGGLKSPAQSSTSEVKNG